MSRQQALKALADGTINDSNILDIYFEEMDNTPKSAEEFYAAMELAEEDYRMGRVYSFDEMIKYLNDIIEKNEEV
jgi:hypothetical protein